MKTLVFAGAAAVASFVHGVSLDGTWRLTCLPETDGTGTFTIPANVPGETVLALERAGMIPDPMVGTNVWGLFEWERRDWKYERTFGKVAAEKGERVVLRFEGVDTRAEYFLNGERLGMSANMFVPVEFDVTHRLKEENALTVILRSPLRDPNEPLGVLGRSRVGGTDVEGIRKAQHSFGWDIMPRLAVCGIWKGVSLAVVPEARIADVHWIVKDTDRAAKTATVLADCRIVAPRTLLHRARLRLTLTRPGKRAVSVEHPLRYFQTRDGLEVSDADLWWPRDAGEPALYDATAELVGADGAVLAADVRRIGLRTVGWERRDWHSERDPGTFRFLVNGEPVYMHGCDWSPMDALHSRDGQHLVRCLEMLVDLNCNMVRVWGGGVYEDDAFYDFCDANGILVWQDFMMGNVEPEQNDAFARTIHDEAKTQILRLRSHPCLAMWCGNNEQDRSVGQGWGRLAPDPAKDRISREVLPRVLRDFDPVTPYMPSSPWWTPDVVAGTARLSQDHLWGSREQYFKGDFWCRNTPTFVSEIGCHGCANVTSLRRMMSPSGLYPWPDKADKLDFNDDWCCKSVSAYPEQRHWASKRNSLMTKQVGTFFGTVPDDLGEFAELSQIYQAQALKYWIELFRSRKGRTWGLLWWNLRDGWPILSDGVVDYWFGKKKSYAAIKSVQQPQLVTVVERGQLVAVNDRLHPVKGRVEVADVDSGRTLHSEEVELPSNARTVLCERLPISGQGCLVVEYVFEGARRVNRCLYGDPPFDAGKVRNWMSE